MVRPLTRHKDGVRYARPAAVEANIDGVLSADLAGLRRRLLVTEADAPDYLRSECLVHLVRAAHRAGDDAKRDIVLPILLGRCEAILRAKVSDSVPNAEELREEVLSELCELLLADGTGNNPDELDFYECRFNSAFRTLRLDVVRRELKIINRNAELPAAEEEGEADDYEDVFARVSDAFRLPATQQSNLYLKELDEAISSLPADQRKAVILVHVFGYDEESDDPEKVTAATLCGCVGRTIRYRLSRAAKTLARFKEDI